MNHAIPHAWAIRFLPFLAAACLQVLRAGAQSSGTDDQHVVLNAATNAAVAEVYANVRLVDGVDEEEALALADVYFRMFVTGCGMIEGVRDHGDRWEVATFVDYDMRAYSPIRVDKATGQVSCEGHPTVVADAAHRRAGDRGSVQED